MNQIELNPTQEQLINDFAFNLAMIDGPDDMFPPDNLGGDREPREPILPSDNDSQFIALAAVYDLLAYRKKKVEVFRKNICDLVLV
jgi:hypothetical protein